jgi:hypothetical protein
MVTSSRVLFVAAFALLVSDLAVAQRNTPPNNVDVVLDCLKKHKDQPKSAVHECAAKNKVNQSTMFEDLLNRVGPGPSKVQPRLAALTEMFETKAAVTKKDVDHDEDWRNSFRLALPPELGNDFVFCGYKAREVSNINSSWRVDNISETGATVNRRVKGQGLLAGGGSLHLSTQSRWLSKLAAGRVEKDIKCENDGWTMKPTGNSKIREHEGCLGFVMVCYDEDPYTKKRSNEVVCGFCVGWGDSF